MPVHHGHVHVFASQGRETGFLRAIGLERRLPGRFHEQCVDQRKDGVGIDVAWCQHVGDSVVCLGCDEVVDLIDDRIGIGAEVDVVEHGSVVSADGVEVLVGQRVADLDVCGVRHPNHDLARIAVAIA